MKSIVRIICCGVAITSINSAIAGEVSVREDGGTVVLESSQAPEAPVSSAPVSSRVTINAHTEKVDRARIEKRMEDRALRTKKRALDAEKDATERAAKAQLNQTSQQQQGVQNGQ